jgi:spermidine synthase
MGFTLAAALKHCPGSCSITVAELIPAVIKWNQTHLGHLTGYPLDSSDVTVTQEDVTHTINKNKAAWDVILLDVDNGPQGLTQKTNDQLYSVCGLKQAYTALKPGGILAVWSARPDEAFTQRLNACHYTTRVVNVRARRSKKGSMHTIWLAQKAKKQINKRQGKY